MALHTRWSPGAITIDANCGEHTPTYFQYPATLLQIRFDDNSTGFYWGEMLKADGGWPELQPAIANAPKAQLNESDLARAFVEAE